MSEIEYLHTRADELRDAAATARDPDVVRALEEVAAEFDREAREEAMLRAVHWTGAQQRA